MKKTIAMLQAEIDHLQELLDSHNSFYETLAPSVLVPCHICGAGILPEDVILLANPSQRNRAFCSEVCLEDAKGDLRHDAIIPKNDVQHKLLDHMIHFEEVPYEQD